MNAVQIAAKLYDMRDTAKRILGERWPAMMARYRPDIELKMVCTEVDALTAARSMVASLQKASPDSGGAQMCILATAVEMVEPSSDGEGAGGE